MTTYKIYQYYIYIYVCVWVCVIRELNINYCVEMRSYIALSFHERYSFTNCTQMAHICLFYFVYLPTDFAHILRNYLTSAGAVKLLTQCPWSRPDNPRFLVNLQRLTHWDRDKMAAISQTTLSTAFSWMKMHELGLRIHWIFSKCSN